MESYEANIKIEIHPSWLINILYDDNEWDQFLIMLLSLKIFIDVNIIINLKAILLVTQIGWHFEREFIAKTNKIVHRLFKDTCKKLNVLKILTKDMPISWPILGKEDSFEMSATTYL